MKFKFIWDKIVLIMCVLEAALVLIFFVPYLFNIKPFVVTSGSMEPKLPVGSLIYVKEVNADTLKKGDVITFYMDDSDIVATHEIYEVNKQKDEFRTYGVNNKDENGNKMIDVNPVKYNDVIGEMSLCIPYFGYINRYVTSSPGIYVVIITTIVIISISFLLDFIKKEEVNKK